MSELLAKLQAAGTVEAKGGFTIDPEKAREKLRQYQLADPHRYVLLLVEAAVSSGATKLEFEIDSDDVHLRCDGAVFGYEQLENIYASLFAQGDELSELQTTDLARLRGLQQLAFALNSAMALNPRFARVVSVAADGTGTALELHPSSRDEVTRVQGQPPGNHIHVKDRFRPGLVVEFFRKLGGSLAEDVLLREHCHWSLTPVTINGERISTAMKFPGQPWSEIDVLDGERIIGRAALGVRVDQVDGKGPLESPAVHLLSNGVYFERCDLDEYAVPGFSAIVDSPRFGKDVSQTKLVHDAGYDAVIESVRAAEARLIHRLAERRLDDRAPPWADEVLLAWLAKRLPARVRRNTLARLLSDDEVFASVATIPLWPIVGAAPITTRTLIEAEGPIRQTRGAYEFAPVDVPFVLLPFPSQQQELLERMFGDRVQDYTMQLQREYERANKRLEFMTRTQLPELGPGHFLVRESILVEPKDGEGLTIRGEFGLRPPGHQVGWVRLVTEGCLLQERIIHGPIPGICALVSAPFTPNHDYDRAQPDLTLAAALVAVLDALERSMAALARSGAVSSGPRAELRALVRAYVQQVCRREYAAEFLEAFGFDNKHARRMLDSLHADPRPRWGLDGPHAEGEAVHPLASVPLYARVEAEPCSLAQLAARRAEGQRLAWLDANIRRLPKLDADVLLLDKADREVLRALLGDDALAPYAERLDWLRRRETFMTRPQLRLVHERATLVSVDFQQQQPYPLRGNLGLREYAYTAVADGRTSVCVHYFARRLCNVVIELPAPGLCAWVDSDALDVGPHFNALAQPMSLRRPLLAALVHLYHAQLGRMHEAQLLRCEWWFLAMMPSIVLGGAELTSMLVSLRSKLELDACLGELDGMLELLERYPGRDVDRALGWLRGRGQPQRVGPLSERLGRPTRRLTEAEQDLAWLRRKLLPALERLLVIPLFRRLTVDGGEHPRAVSLDALLACVAADRPISWVGEDFHIEALPSIDFEILVLDPIELRAIEALFGSTALELVSDWLIGRARFERRKTISEVRIARGSALFVIDIDAPGMRGQLGIARLPPGEATRSKVRVFTESREITTLDLPARPLALVGALEFDAIELNDAHEDLTVSARGEVQQLVLKRANELLLGLAKHFAELERADRPRAAELVRYLLHTWPPGTGGYAARAKNNSHVFERLAELPVFPGARKPWSAVELAGARDRSRLATISYRRPASELPDQPIIVLESADILPTLNALFGSLRDYDEELEQRRALASRKAAAPALPRQPPARALASITVDGEGVHGLLWLADDDDEVRLGQDGKVVVRQRLSPLYQFAGAIEGPRLTISQDWTRATLTRGQLRLLERLGNEMWGTLLDDFIAGSELANSRKHGERQHFAELRDAIHRLFLRLQAQYGRGRQLPRKSKRKQGNRHEKLLARVWELPILQLSNGRWISPEVATRERPIELADMKLWSGPSAEELEHRRAAERREAERERERQRDEQRERERAAARARAEAQAREREAERRRLAEAEARRLAERDAREAKVAAPPAAAPAPQPQAQAQPAPKKSKSKSKSKPGTPTVVPTASPQELLLEALREELRLVRADNAGLIANRRLDAIDLGEPVRRGPLFRHADGVVEIDTGHPVFVAALDGYLDDPGLLTLLASALYSYLNIIHLDIEDTHEAEFIRRHAAYAASGAASGSG